jgi:putative methionine-R-sulfoxide reductase with GAF domain
LIGQSIFHNKIINADDVTKYPYYFCAVPETRSELAIPITHQGKAIGAFYSESELLSYYNPEIVD